MNQYGDFGKETEELMTICERNDRIPPELFKEFGVKRGLRDVDGTGVLAGISNISRIDAFKTEDGKKVPCDGQLWYRGYNVIDLIHGFEGKRFGFEEVAYLLLFGELPDAAKLGAFKSMLEECRQLPTNFTRDVIMKAPSKDIMNSLTRSVLTLASYDETIADQELHTQLEQCIKLISVFPMLAVYGYHAYNHYICDDSLYIHRPQNFSHAVLLRRTGQAIAAALSACRFHKLFLREHRGDVFQIFERDILLGRDDFQRCIRLVVHLCQTHHQLQGISPFCGHNHSYHFPLLCLISLYTY